MRILRNMWNMIQNNHLLQAAVGYPAATLARDMIRLLIQDIRSFVTRKLCTTITLRESDAAIAHGWLCDRPEMQSLSERSISKRVTSGKYAGKYEYEPVLKSTTRVWVGWRPIWFELHGDWNKGEPHLRGMTITVLRPDATMVETILEEGRTTKHNKIGQYLTVIPLYKGHWWYPKNSEYKQPARPIESVVLHSPEGKDVAKEVLDECMEFVKSEDWYAEQGIPWRRGYLLYGVPGSGKSSLAMAIASHIKLPLYCLSLSDITDDRLPALLQEMGDPPTLLVLEDVDRAHPAVLAESESLVPRSSAAAPNEQKPLLTLSGLLNALDGPTASAGRILFMTTNNYDKLDKALIRSRRVDKEIEFKAANPQQMEHVVKRFYARVVCNPDILIALAKQLYKEGEGKLTVADVQVHLIQYKTDPSGALAGIPSWLEHLRGHQSERSRL